jgi:hypothetical protein
MRLWWTGDFMAGSSFGTGFPSRDLTPMKNAFLARAEEGIRHPVSYTRAIKPPSLADMRLHGFANSMLR